MVAGYNWIIITVLARSIYCWWICETDTHTQVHLKFIINASELNFREEGILTLAGRLFNLLRYRRAASSHLTTYFEVLLTASLLFCKRMYVEVIQRGCNKVFKRIITLRRR